MIASLRHVTNHSFTVVDLRIVQPIRFIGGMPVKFRKPLKGQKHDG